jgi:hypothetical protein
VKLELTKDQQYLARACDYFRKDYDICVQLEDTGGAAKTLESMRQFGCPLPDLGR